MLKKGKRQILSQAQLTYIFHGDMFRIGLIHHRVMITNE